MTIAFNSCLRSLLALSLLIAATIASAALPQQSIVPGGIAIIDLESTDKTPPEATYTNKRILTLKHEGRWHAVIGIPLSAKPGDHQLALKTATGHKHFSFTVEGKAYETQRLTIKNKRKVNPNNEDMERIISEKTEINHALAYWNDELLLDEIYFMLPVQGRLSSPFGLRRYFNDQPRRPHSGLDIAAPTGTPIVAPADGVIIESGDYFFNGSTVFIDHGRGLVTMYCHMDSIDVKNGERVTRGQHIGTVGKSGRVTGPHLHWGVSLNDSRVDPSLFVPELRDAPELKPRPRLN